MNLSQLEREIGRYFAAGPAATGDPAAMTAFLALRSALGNRRGARCRARRNGAHRMARECLGQAGHPARLSPGRAGGVGLPAGSPLSTNTPTRRGCSPPVTAYASFRAARRCAAGAYVAARRGLHAAHVHQRRAPTWTRAPWSIRTRSSAPARRSASAFT